MTKNVAMLVFWAIVVAGLLVIAGNAANKFQGAAKKVV